MVELSRLLSFQTWLLTNTNKTEKIASESWTQSFFCQWTYVSSLVAYVGDSSLHISGNSSVSFTVIDAPKRI